MPDLILSWGDVPASGGGPGGYGTQLTAPTTIPTGGTGGVEVTVVSNIQQEGATTFTVNQPNFDVPAEGIPEQSALKLFSDGIAPAGTSDTMTTSLIFGSNDPLYQDSVTDVSFRLFDIDSGDINDDPSDPTGGSPHTDIVTIRAFDADGNEVPVVISPGSDITVTGNTLQGDPNTDGESIDGPISSLIEIAGPIARIEIDYNNGGTGTQEVLVSDLLLTTIDSGINDDPNAVDDAFSTELDTDVTFNVLGNDSDPDLDTLTLTSVTPTLGSVTFSPAGDVVYTPPGGFIGTDTLTYTISDGNGGTDIATVTITVDPDVNDAPVAVDDTATTPVDTLLSDIDVLGNDSDANGDALTVTSATSPDGTVTINGDGSLDFDPNAGFTGPATVTYVITDGVEFDTGTLTVTVTPPVNDPPVAVDDTASTLIDTLLEDIPVLGNDSDPNGDPLSVTAASSPDGLVTINGDGTLNFDPNAGFTGPATVTYTLSDGTSTDTGTLTVNVSATPNNPPVAVDDSAATTIDTAIASIDVLANDSDPDGNPLSVTGATAPNGTVSINGDGTLQYTPDAGFTGTDTISYVLSDGLGGTDVGSVTVGVTDPATNDAPVAVNDVLLAESGVNVPIVDVLGNDSDPDGDPLTVTSATSPNGTVTINGDGSLSYTADPGFTGTDIVTYTIDDGNGGTDTAIVRVSVREPSAPNNAPTAVDDTAATTTGTVIPSIDVLGNDTDPDGDPLTVTGATAPNGTVVINGDGTLEYTPDAGFSGPDTISYVISDGNGGTDVGSVAVTVTDPASNNDPVATNDVLLAQSGVNVPTVDVLGNDTDPDGDPLTVTSATSPNGTVTINGDGTLSYTADPGFTGTDIVTYTISDGAGGTDTAIVRVSVSDPAPGNNAPTAVDDAAATTTDTVIPSIDVLGNDTDPDGDPLTVTGATAPNGTVTINGDGTLEYTPDAGFSGPDTISYVISDGNGGTDVGTVAVTVTDPASNTDPVANNDVLLAESGVNVPVVDVLGNDTDADGDPLTVTSASSPNGTVTINGDGTLSYTADPGFTGTDLVTYEISDGNGGTDTAIVRVSVSDPAPGNNAPTAVDDTAATTTGTVIPSIDVLGNDTDPDGDPLTVTGATAPNGTVTINGDGTLEYTPDAGFSGPDTISYVISDGNGGTDVGTVAVTVTDPASNTDPVANNDVLLAESGVNVPVVDVLGNDTDADGDPLTVTSATSPNGTVTINGDGTLSYTADPGFTGTDLVTYEISDGNGGTDTAIVRVSVSDPAPGNNPPVANPDTAATPVDTLLEDIPVLANDSDPDGDPLTVTAATAPNGTVTINGDGTLDYQPTGGFEGFDTITYTISDGNGGTVSSAVTVTVGSPPANSAPDAVDDAPQATPVDTAIASIDVLSNDTDPDGDPLTVTAATAPNGTVTINGDGTLAYSPNAGFVGEDTITYEITDSISGSDTATVVITVGTPNTDPDADPDTATTTAITPVTIFPLGNDTDPEGDPLTITAATAPNGTVTISPDGTSVEYTPNAGFDNDVDSITYTISDGNGGSDTSSIQVLVGTPVQDGIVEGTGAGEYIGTDNPLTTPVDPYLGDPEGDQVDNSDAILPGAGAEDDVIEAGGGDDTVEAGLGDDFVNADTGDDSVTTGEGDDTVIGGAGDDTIDTGEGDDSVFSGDDNDSITTGDGSDTVLAGLGDDTIDTSGGIPLLDDAPFPSIITDADPDDDKDFVDADEGDDLITTGDDDDTIIGGEGNDTIFSGIDDDSVIGDGGDDSIVDVQGADFIDGGAGDDTINAGVDSFTDYVGDDPNLPITDSGITFVTDPDQDDGRDTVFGGTGNDLIFTGDDADSIDGGDDNDTIFAGIDDDTVRGGDGDDSIEGGHGADTISGGAGNDYIDAGHTSTATLFEDEPDATEPAGLELNDRDSVLGGNGDDTIFGGDDDDFLSGGNGRDVIDGGIDEDTIDGGAGDDSLDGGDGDDSIIGGTGDDTVTGGAGADTISTGGGEDSIIGGNIGDVVDGGEGPTDFDTLDLTGVGAAQNPGGRITIDYDPGNIENGTVNFLDAADVVTGTMSFVNIENVIPCFTPGTLIATPTGQRKVEDLVPGDRVITRDNGIQEIRWAGAKDLSGAQLAANEHLQPVLISAGALGDNLPETDILVSPQHRMLLTTDQAAMYFEEREVLVAAKHLTILDGVDRVESSGTTYIHIMFEQHEVVLSNGTWSESFQPGDYTLDGIGKEQRDEILELFPELATQVGTEAYQSARRTLKKYEAALLLG